MGLAEEWAAVQNETLFMNELWELGAMSPQLPQK